MDDLYATAPHLDKAAVYLSAGNTFSARNEANIIASLAQQALDGLASLSVWSPGEQLVLTLNRSANDLYVGAATFITGLDANDTDEMRTGALRMDSGGKELTSAQHQLDALSALYGAAGC